MNYASILKALRTPAIQKRRWRIRNGGLRDRYGCCPLLALAKTHSLTDYDNITVCGGIPELNIDESTADYLVGIADNPSDDPKKAQRLCKAVGLDIDIKKLRSA